MISDCVAPHVESTSAVMRPVRSLPRRQYVSKGRSSSAAVVMIYRGHEGFSEGRGNDLLPTERLGAGMLTHIESNNTQANRSAARTLSAARICGAADSSRI